MSKFPGLITPFGLGGGGAGGGGTNASGFISGGSVVNVDPLWITAEAISGIKAVAFTNSGAIWISMPGVSGRIPSFGIVLDNVTSGQSVIVYRGGPVFGKSGQGSFNFSGWTTDPIYIGASGDCVASGAVQTSGAVIQLMGVVTNASGMEITVGDPFEPFVAQSGDCGSGVIQGQAGGGFFNIGSGSINQNDLGSGYNAFTNSDFTWTAGEAISGFRAVTILSGMTLGLANAASGLRLPCVGVVPANFVSGAVSVGLYLFGRLSVTSGLDATWSGMAGRNLYAGSGGTICTQSGLLSGMAWQRIGFATSGGLMIFVDPQVTSGGNAISVLGAATF